MPREHADNIRMSPIAIRRVLAGAWLVLSAVWAGPVAAGEPQLVRPGTYHGDELAAVSGESWLALRHVPDGRDRLEAVTVRVDTVRDEILDEADAPATGRMLSAPGDSAIAFLFRGVPGLREGPVNTVTADEMVALGEPVRLALAGDTLDVVLACGPRQVTGQLETAACSLFVRRVHATQTLRSYQGYYQDGEFGGIGNDAIPIVLWAGDLDGDGALDLVVELTDHYNVSRPTLFMSRRSIGCVVLEKIAEHVSTGC